MFCWLRSASWKSEPEADCIGSDTEPKKISEIALPCRSDSGMFAIVVENAFSKEECDRMIRETESKGYEAAMLNVGDGQELLDTDIRKGSRCIVDSPEQAAEIWNRVRDCVPAVWKHRGTSWEVVGLNERLRFLRYSPGDYFISHCDSSYEREAKERSFITLLLLKV